MALICWFSFPTKSFVSPLYIFIWLIGSGKPARTHTAILWGTVSQGQDTKEFFTGFLMSKTCCQLPTDGNVLIDSKEVSQHKYIDPIFEKSLMDFNCPFSKLTLFTCCLRRKHIWGVLLGENVVVVFQFLTYVQLFLTPWTAAYQASLSSTISQSLLKLMSSELVMPSRHLILCILLLPSIFPGIRVFSDGSAPHISWPKFWSFSFSISPSNEYSGLISFRIDGFDLSVV